MAATSHPLATDAALATLRAGGNACDAAVAAAGVLCVCEPMSTGVGGDLFAVVWRDGDLTGLNASGRAPRGADPDALTEVPAFGPMSVTVPGAVSGWAALLERHGRLGLDRCLAPAIGIAERGFAVTPVIADEWSLLATDWALDPELAAVYTPAPRAGETARNPALAATLRSIAGDGPDALYRGAIAEAICAASWLEESDLADHRPEWVAPLRLAYRDVEVVELPPNGQGAAALQALAIAEGFDLAGAAPADRVHLQAEATKLALCDAHAHIADAPLPDWFLEPAHIAGRRRLVDPTRAAQPIPGMLPAGGTVYLCVVDEDRTACSLIQSLYHGARVGAPGTGIQLHNRGAAFTLEPGHPNRLAPGRRPFHTIIPGMLLRGGRLLGPFGVMGGHMQAQGHLQVVSAMVDRGLDPQQAIDAPRFRCDPTLDGWRLALEPGLRGVADDLASRGHRLATDDTAAFGFGGAQAIIVRGGKLLGGSDPRKDGCAAGI